MFYFICFGFGLSISRNNEIEGKQFIVIYMNFLNIYEIFRLAFLWLIYYFGVLCYFTLTIFLYGMRIMVFLFCIYIQFIFSRLSKYTRIKKCNWKILLICITMYFTNKYYTIEAWISLFELTMFVIINDSIYYILVRVQYRYTLFLFFC